MLDWDNLAYILSGGRHQTFEGYTNHIIPTLIQGTIDTMYMVGFASLFAIIFGMLIGLLLYITQPNGIHPVAFVNRFVGIIVNIGRSIPFVVMIILVFPLSQHIVGTSIGRTAAIVPLTIAAIPFMSRVVESALNELSHGIIEAATAAGATTRQIIFRVILPESAPALVGGFTLLIINLITFSAMAGMVGGGGLGHLANSYGLQRHRTDILMYVVVILVILVQIIQGIGQMISRKLDKR
ncbi:MAG: ABC transporter permease [Defluviitaleaceae bacterium]|nr:ABC transporter permease [Defluviitaleaceae bacterium]